MAILNFKSDGDTYGWVYATNNRNDLKLCTNPFYATHVDPDGYNVTFIIDDKGMVIGYRKESDTFFYSIDCDFNYTTAYLIVRGLEEIDVDQYLDEIKQYYTKRTGETNE